VQILAGECSLYSNYLVQSSCLFGVGAAFPHLFFGTAALGFFQLHVHSVIPCFRSLTTEPSPEGVK